MPATFPSHAAAVLPLKLWRPRWFDGVALVIGSAAPDLSYPLDGTWLERPVAGWPATWEIAHSWPGILLWGVPVTVACSLAIRLAAPTVAAHLPARPRILALRDYGVLGRSRPAWPVTVLSAAVGAASHVLWDRVAEHGFVDLASSVCGALVTVAAFVHIGRRRLLRDWHGPAPDVRTNPLWFWGTALATLGAGMVVLPLLPGAGLVHTSGVRFLCLAALALMLGAVASRRA